MSCFLKVSTPWWNALTDSLCIRFLLFIPRAVVAEPAAPAREEDAGADAFDDFAAEVEETLEVFMVPAGDLRFDPRSLRADERDFPDFFRELPEELLVRVGIGRHLDVVREG